MLVFKVEIVHKNVNKQCLIWLRGHEGLRNGYCMEQNNLFIKGGS